VRLNKGSVVSPTIIVDKQLDLSSIRRLRSTLSDTAPSINRVTDLFHSEHNDSHSCHNAINSLWMGPIQMGKIKRESAHVRACACEMREREMHQLYVYVVPTVDLSLSGQVVHTPSPGILLVLPTAHSRHGPPAGPTEPCVITREKGGGSECAYHSWV